MRRVILPQANKEDWMVYKKNVKYMFNNPFVLSGKAGIIIGFDFGINQVFTRRCLVSSKNWGTYKYGIEIYKGKLKKIK